MIERASRTLPSTRDTLVAAVARGDRATAVAVEAHGWDGAWYHRAYFDDRCRARQRERVRPAALASFLGADA